MIFSPATPTLHYGQLAKRTSPLNKEIVHHLICLPSRGHGNTWLDVAPDNLHHGTLSGGTDRRGALGRPAGYGSLFFDGTAGKVDFPSLSNYYGGKTQLAFSWWMRPSSSGNRTVFAVYQSATASCRFYIVNALFRLGVEVRLTDFTGVLMETANNAVVQDTWQHWFVVIDGEADQHYIFRNGVQLVSSTQATGALDAGADGTFDIGGFGNKYHGYFDSLRAYEGLSAQAGSEMAWRLYREESTGYPTTMNRIRLPVVGEVGAAPAATQQQLSLLGCGA